MILFSVAVPDSQKSGLSKGAVAGIALGTAAGAVTISAIVFIFIMRRHMRNWPSVSRKRRRKYLSTY